MSVVNRHSAYLFLPANIKVAYFEEIVAVVTIDPIAANYCTQGGVPAIN